MKYLDEALYEYGDSGFYPFHMPGHKRQRREGFLQEPFRMDITEITGFDNLHHPEGILRENQEYAASLYGTRKTYFLVNGSTAGILAAVSASVSRGGRLLMARNCHKAVYHGACLRGLDTVYLYPSWEKIYGLNGGISPEEVEKALEENRDIEAVLLTSPSYDGMISDIERIAKIVHRRDLPLVVDEAHGAHLPFWKGAPNSALYLGADIVIQSLHKTLPALTQTAVLHVCSERADLTALERFLGIYQTSSPSYVFLSSMVSCLRFLERRGEEEYRNYASLLETCRKRLRSMKRLKLIGEETEGKGGVFAFDRSKLLISGEGAGLSGPKLHKILREKYSLEMEMETEKYVLALTSVFDTREGFRRLTEALLEIDREAGESADRGVPQEWNCEFREGRAFFEAKKACSIAEGMEAASETVNFLESRGRISGEYAYLYPPGIPLLVPGERIGEEFLERAAGWERQGIFLQGLSDYTQKTIRVIKE